MRLIRWLPLLLFKFRHHARMFLSVMLHRETPGKARLVALLAVLYAISPIDFIPDAIPFLGWLDDIGVVTLLVRWAYRLLPRDLYEALHARAFGSVPADGGMQRAQRSAPAPQASRDPAGPAARAGRIIDVTPEP